MPIVNKAAIYNELNKKILELYQFKIQFKMAGLFIHMKKTKLIQTWVIMLPIMMVPEIVY